MKEKRYLRVNKLIEKVCLEYYRFSFNGKETDKEWGGSGIQDYGFRLYNPAIAKFLSVDPLAPSFPFYTPYQFAGNKPIMAIDLDGLEERPMITWDDPGILRSLSKGVVTADDVKKNYVKPLGTVGAVTTGALAAGVTFGLLGTSAIVTAVGNEVKDEALSQLTGGWSDLMDLTKSFRNLFRSTKSKNLLGRQRDIETGYWKETDVILGDINFDKYGKKIGDQNCWKCQDIAADRLLNKKSLNEQAPDIGGFEPPSEIYSYYGAKYGVPKTSIFGESSLRFHSTNLVESHITGQFKQNSLFALIIKRPSFFGGDGHVGFAQLRYGELRMLDTQDLDIFPSGTLFKDLRFK